MKDYSLKFKYLLLPYFLCLIGVIVGCTLFHWIFIIQLDWLPVTEEVIEFFIPAGVSILTVLLFLRKGINRLKFRQNNGADFLYFITMLGIFIPTLIAQEYLATSTGKLTVLEQISEINQHAKTKYYALNRYYFYKKGVGVFQRYDFSGKHNEHLDFYIYTITPILNTPKDTLKDNCNYWLCKRYLKTISSHVDDVIKEREYNDFLSSTHQEYKSAPITFSYLELMDHKRDLKYYESALKRAYYKSVTGTDIFFSAAEDKFENRNGKKLLWVFLSSLIGLVVFGLLLLAYPHKTASELSKDERRIKRDRARGWRKQYEWILPQEKFLITPLLLYLNVLIYIGLVIAGAGFITFDSQVLYKWGAVIRSAVYDGQWWRLLTAVFLHGGIMHLLNNMLSLYFIGWFLEPLLGKWRYLTLYLACGLIASFASIYWHEATLSVGASGAIFGLYGFILALTLFKIFDPLLNKEIVTFAGIFVVVNLIYGLAGGVDNAAHIGGLCAGLFFGILLSGNLGIEKNSRK